MLTTCFVTSGFITGSLETVDYLLRILSVELGIVTLNIDHRCIYRQHSGCHQALCLRRETGSGASVPYGTE